MTQELVITSKMENLADVRDFVESLLTSLPFSEKERANIVFCLIEAAINAMNHGNHNDPSKLVRIIFEGYPDRIVMSVKDQGAGFNPDSIGDPREPNRLKSPSGRGIFFMRQMLSSVNFDFSPSGTTVYLEKFFNNNNCK